MPLIIFLITVNLFSQSEPLWINNYPADDLYFSGIGSSNTGNKSNDYERALIQARLNLASEISTSINAETQIVTHDSSNGGYSESFTEKLNQSVEQNLKELEIVDTYYARSQGYWVYIRLNKTRWKSIQNEEMSLLLSRIQQILNDDYFDNRATTADKLFKLASVSGLLEQSPYSTIVKGELSDVYLGNIYDFVQSEIYRISSTISIILAEQDFTLETGEDFELIFSGKGIENYPGKIPYIIYNDEMQFYKVYSDLAGVVRLNMNSEFFQEGRNIMTIFVDSNQLGFTESSNLTKNFISEQKEFAVVLQSASLFLNINSNKRDLDFVAEPLSTIFAKGDENFQLTDKRSEASYEISLSLNFTDYPRVIENAPLMAGLNCIISLKKNNRLLIEHKINTIKDGGLTYEQAYRRVFNKLISILEQDRTYIHEIEDEINN